MVTAGAGWTDPPEAKPCFTSMPAPPSHAAGCQDHAAATRITSPAKTSPGFVPRQLGLLKLTDSGFLLFQNKEEIPRAPPAAEIINNLSKTTTRRSFSPRRAPPRSSPPPPPPPPALRRRGLRQRDWISRESLCRAGSLCKSFTFIWFDPRLPRSRRSGGESMTARDGLGWGREC